MGGGLELRLFRSSVVVVDTERTSSRYAASDALLRGEGRAELSECASVGCGDLS